MINVLAVTTDLDTTESFVLDGPCRIRSDNLECGDWVDLYEEDLCGSYDRARDGCGGPLIRLEKYKHSRLVHGYGRYKMLGSKEGLICGYCDGSCIHPGGPPWH
jgi:hypothetical protein